MKRLLVNRYTQEEVQIWCRLFWSKDDDLDIEELQEDLYQFELEPPKPPKPPSLAEMLREPEETEFKVAPEPLWSPPSYYPDWYAYDIRETGLGDVIDPGRMQNWGDQFDAWAFWALENGLAPLQPFLLRIPMPRYTRSYLYEYGCYEYDAEYSHDVIDRIPMKDSQALKQWERYLKSFGWEISCLAKTP